MKILLGHVFEGHGAFGAPWIEAWLSRLRVAGIDVHPINLSMRVPGRRMPWQSLDRAWRRGDRQLMQLYARIAHACESADVLINYGGVNLHPEFLRQLPVVSALGFFDDPESSDDFSRPVAAGHDICLVGNVAELDAYRAWGARGIEWWPNGYRADDFDSALTESQILSGARDVPVTLMCERVTHYRRRRVDRFAAAFPEGAYYGPGWPAGFLPESDRVPLLQRTRIGVNIHNSTGPINFRTFYLPANGVLQLCDNRSHLARVFELGSEVIGYDTIEEAIDLTRYYLAHEEERRAVAAAGWRRALRDYNEVAAFRRVVDAVAPLVAARKPTRRRTLEVLAEHTTSTAPRRALALAFSPVTVPLAFAKRIATGGYRRAAKFRDDLIQRMRRRWGKET